MILRPVRPVTLSGPFVRLEPLAEAHGQDLRAAAADPRIWTWLARDGATPEGFAAWMDEALAESAAGHALPFVVRRQSDDRLIGSTRYLNIEPRHGRLEIGHTWYVPEAWGGPVNPACKRLLLAHAFEELGAVRVELRCDARNDRSRAAIRRLGAVEEGVLRRHMAVRDGFIRDTVQFSVLDGEWPAVRAALDDRLARFADAPTAG